MQPTKKEIVVIGDGVVGWSTCYHLKVHGIYNTCLVGEPQLLSESSRAAGSLTAGYLDHFTRLQHHFGEKEASSLWQFSLDAYKETLDFLKQTNTPYWQNKLLRLGVSSHETTELLEANKLLKKNGFFSDLLALEKENLGNRVSLVQDLGKCGGLVDPGVFLNTLKEKTDTVEVRSAKVMKIDSSGEFVTVTLADQSKILCEMFSTIS